MNTLDTQIVFIVAAANDQSIAAGRVTAFVQAGAKAVVTYDNVKAKPLSYPSTMPPSQPPSFHFGIGVVRQMNAVLDTVKDRWGRLDVVLHSIIDCPEEDLKDRVADCARIYNNNAYIDGGLNVRA